MPSPAQVVIFGASGDLTRRKLVPALARLAAEAEAQGDEANGANGANGASGPNGAGAAGAFHVIGVARRPKTDDEFRRELAEALTGEAQQAFERLAPRVHYHQGDARDPASLGALRQRLDDLPGGSEAGRLFYLSLKPDLFGETTRALADAALVSSEPGREPWRRVVIEKPFGHDLASARQLNDELHRVLREDQIFRIDHYLGKETVQNLIGFRFHNAVFEPIWNRHHVELVQITVAESIGVEAGRAGYYEETGALRDMLQNHMLQLLALVAMEPPASLEAEALRNQKVELLRALHCPSVDEVRGSSVRGRYGPGAVAGKPVVGYGSEEGVHAGSQTETFVALRAEVDNWRWSGVPFLLRHGKRLAQRFTEIQVQFRSTPLQLFNRPEGMPSAEFRRRLRDGSLCQIRPNVLTLAIQPREQIHLSFGVKRPGAQMRMAPASLGFDYVEHFGEAPPDAYERLLLDAICGDQTLFLRADEIEASWRYADEVLDGWRGAEAPPLIEYPAGGWGPDEANELFYGCEGGWSRG